MDQPAPPAADEKDEQTIPAGFAWHHEPWRVARVVDQALDAMETGALLKQRSAAFHALRDLFYPSSPEAPAAAPMPYSDAAWKLAQAIYDKALRADACAIPCPGIDEMEPLIRAAIQQAVDAEREQTARWHEERAEEAQSQAMKVRKGSRIRDIWLSNSHAHEESARAIRSGQAKPKEE